MNKRSLRHAANLIGSAFVMLTTTSCQFGSVGFAGDLGGRGFDPNGTVFSYLDENDENLSPKNDERLIVFMTWLLFHPEVDLNERSGSELEELRHEFRLRDALAVIFDDKDTLEAGAAYAFETSEGDVAVDDGVRIRLHREPERLTGASTYSDFKSFGSKRHYEVTVDSINLVSGGSVSGTIVVEISRADADPSSSLTGRIEGSFQAPLISERIAEHNLALLEVEPVMGLPDSPTTDENEP